MQALAMLFLVIYRLDPRVLLMTLGITKIKVVLRAH
jgi:hypothetical protein